MPILAGQVNCSSNFSSSFKRWTKGCYFGFLLWTKGRHLSPNFDTFQCSGENLPNLSCHFPNHKSVFLQIFHHSSVSWKITPLYFFKSKVIYFAQKKPVKVNFLETFECSGQNSPNSCHFWNKKLVFLQILYYFSVSWDITFR